MFSRRLDWSSSWGQVLCGRSSEVSKTTRTVDECDGGRRCLFRHEGGNEGDGAGSRFKGDTRTDTRTQRQTTSQTSPQTAPLVGKKRPSDGHEPGRDTGSLGGVRGVRSAENDPKAPPRLAPSPSYLPMATRQAIVDLFYTEYRRLYQAIPGNLAREHALEQEASVYRQAAKATYKNAALLLLARLKRREPASGSDEQGLEETVEARKRQRTQDQARALERIDLDKVLSWLPDETTLQRYGFLLEVPPAAAAGVSSSGQTPQDGSVVLVRTGETTKCKRCAQTFTLDPSPKWNACRYHWGKAVVERRGANGREKAWTCCRASFDALGCTSGPHVFEDDNLAALHARIPFIATPERRHDEDKLDLIALDCEMAHTTAGLVVSRLCLIDGVTGERILDELVRAPDDVVVLDPNTRFSGVTLEDLASAVIVGTESIRRILLHYIDAQTVIIGHGLDNDLRALRLVHRRVLDSAILYRHPKGPPFRYSLRLLATKIMGRFVQAGELVEDGGQGQGHGQGEVLRASHDAQEDAKTALELVKLKVHHGPGFGRII